MKKILNLFVYLILMTLLCACGTSSNPNNIQTTESSSSNTEQTVQTTDTSSKAEQSTVNPSDKTEQVSPDDSAWRAAYLEILEANKDCRSFALVYVDDNDVPELYIMGISEAEGDRVFSYLDGKVITLQLGRTGGGKYIERGGMIANENGNMGRYYTDIFELDWYGFSRTLHGATIVRYNFETGKDEYSYSIMGEDVSEETFYALVHAEFNFSRAVKFTDSAVSYETVKQQLENEDFLPGGYQTGLPEKYQDVLDNQKRLQYRNESIFLNEAWWIDADRTYWEYCLIDMDGDGSVEMLIDMGQDILLLTVEYGKVYGFDFSFRGMYYAKVDGSFCWNYHAGYGESKIKYFYNGTYKEEELYRVEWGSDGNPDKYFIKGEEVTEEEFVRYVAENPRAEQVTWHKLDTYPNGSSDSKITFIPQSEKDTYKEKLTAILSATKKSSYMLGSFSAFGAGLMDINFDNVPEVLVAYPGGSMGNVFIQVYDLETGEEICTYNMAHYNSPYNIYMCVAEHTGGYVILTEGSYRDGPELGWIKLVGVLYEELSSDDISGKTWFAEAESEKVSYYQYNGENVSKEEYQRQFGKFTMEYDKIEETQIIIVKWSDVGFDYEQSDGSDIDFYAEKLAEALLGSGQEFIEYQK